MNYYKARSLADRIVEILYPHCSQIQIAGSIRRLKPEPKDIELVATPLKSFIQESLFGDGKYVTLPGFKVAMDQFTVKVIKGQVDGRYMRIQIKGGQFLDLFMPDESDYFRQLAIRTGSSRYSNQVIAQGWVKKGWRGTDQGLRRLEDCEARISGDKTIYKCIAGSPAKPPHWASEEEFFDWIDIKWIHPSKREILIPNLAL